MRKFKFRAWRHDGEYSHMIESPIGVFTALKHCLGVATPAGFSDIDNQPKKGGYTLMQWTGLKDRNGKEIYEGDIIQDERGKKYLIKWGINSNGFIAKTNEAHCNVYSSYHLSFKTQVIGNIYENPELLESGG